jgi:hypothetical protein
VNKSVRKYAISSFLLLTAACSRAQHAAAHRVSNYSNYQDQLSADSAALATTTDTIYQRRLRDLIRRARLVPVDSLARLYASIPSTPDSALHGVRQEIGCEGLRLMATYGQAAQLRAFGRMEDSLERSGFDYQREAERMLSANGPLLHIRNGDCGVTFPRSRLPDSLYYEVHPTKYMKPGQTVPGTPEATRVKP